MRIPKYVGRLYPLLGAALLCSQEQAALQTASNEGDAQESVKLSKLQRSCVFPDLQKRQDS